MFVHSQIISNYAGGGVSLGDGGPSTAALVSLPAFCEFDVLGNFYFFQNLSAPRIRKVTPGGIITTIAGNGVAGFSGDGLTATTAMIRPQGITVDLVGNVYIADYYNNRVRKVEVYSGIIQTIAGNGTPTSTGNGAAASACTIVPLDLCTDGNGNVFISDNNGSIRKIDALTGKISMVAATSALGMCFDNHGNLILGGGVRIFKVDTMTGNIDTIAGTGAVAFNGDNIPATSANMRVFDVTVDDTGNIYFADHINDRVRKINTVGIITTIAGTGIESYSGDGGLASAATIHNPEGVAIDACGNLCIADEANNRIRKVTFNPPTTPTITITGISSVSLGATVTVNATVTGAGSSYSIKWFKNSTLFSTTTLPSTTYIKGTGTDEITAKVIPTIINCYDSTTSLKHYVTQSSVAVKEIGVLSFTASLYPNPAQNVLTISATGRVNKIIVSNLIGQMLLDKKYDSEIVQVDIAKLPAGIYFVRINDQFLEKFIKD